MTYRQLKPKSLIEQPESKLSDRPLAIIARQSSTAQIEDHVESLKLQVEDARQRFIAQGWSANIITIRIAGDGKKGVSGTLRIDQRAELQQTIADIKAGTCKAVGAYDVSRLFRDKFGVESGTFAKICHDHDVLIITHNYTFDFNRNPMDVFLFRFLAEQAADENRRRADLTKAARKRKSLRGGYDGRSLTPGFIVDRDKGSPTYGKYLEYVPHAEVARKLYARFRELGGQFNVLANEVARMPVVFPDFEAWVDPLNVLRLKKVPGGYHISRVALFHLLTAIEYVGFWKVDGSLLTDTEGMPVVNHDAIVPFSDWDYAFTHLSFETLDGLPNQERTHGTTWTPVTKQESEGLLRGLLTSPLGTVNCSAGRYRVAEQRPGHPQRSTTLMVDMTQLDRLFRHRLALRMCEVDNTAFFHAHLARLKKQHAKELVSVDEQIARYTTERAGIQAYIKAVGATADTATLQQYNADLLDISAHIAELEAKKHAARVEKSIIARMKDRFSRVRKLMGTKGPNEYSKRFIQLCCDTISLDRHSAHFITLTIHWAAPFRQVDICYLYRAAGVHQQWSTQDEEDLKRLYPCADRLELYQRFPTRTWQSLVQLAYQLGVIRRTSLNTSGITDPRLSLADWQLFQQHGWELPTGDSAAYWVYNVKINTLESPSGRS